MSGPADISDDDLHAFIDGALEPDRALSVRQALARDPALADRIAAFQADKAMLKQVYAPLADRPLPQEWITRIHRRPQSPWRWATAIAAALLVAVATPLAWHHLTPTDGDVVEAALDSRQDAGACDANASPAQYDSQLRQAVASNLRVPELNRMGFKLCGLHRHGNAVEIAYRGPQDQLFTLTIRRSDGSVRFDQFERRGLRVCIWQDDLVSTVMAGNISPAVMQRLATLSYTGLTT
jgi:anti-sigma factor RsiW